MAKLGRRRIAREVVRLLREQPAKQADIVQQLAGYVIANKMVNQVDLLLLDIADELYAQDGQLDATVEHTFDLSEATKTAIADLLKAKTGATTVALNDQQNPDLLGGVIVRTARYQLDASVRTQLKQISLGGKL
jgi:F0F1-type ATP synthase delta subunit